MEAHLQSRSVVSLRFGFELYPHGTGIYAGQIGAGQLTGCMHQSSCCKTMRQHTRVLGLAGCCCQRNAQHKEKIVQHWHCLWAPCLQCAYTTKVSHRGVLRPSRNLLAQIVVWPCFL